MHGLKDVFDSIADASIRDLDVGDYMYGGLAHCGNCRTPKQTVIIHPFSGEKRIVGCLCKCGKERLEAIERESASAERQRRIESLRRKSFTDSDFACCTFDRDDCKEPELAKQMRNYAKHFETFRENGQGLILFGNVGTGKTFYSACIANALMDDGYTVMMTNFPTLISRLQKTAFDKTDYMSELVSYDLLIIDDLGVESSSEFRQENVYAVIDARYRAKKPVIVSTNLTAEELRNPKDVMSARIYGRILERCLPIRFNGKDRRKGNTCYEQMRAILNG